MPMRFALPFLLIAEPALAAAPHQRTSPEWSDIALFVVAAIGVWLVRRGLRKRFAKPARPTKD